MSLAIGVALGLATLPAHAHGGYALVDLADATILEESGANAAIAPNSAADLLLIVVVCERIASGALEHETLVPVVIAPGDGGSVITSQKRLAVGELLQLLMLGGSRSAALSLAAGAGPGIDRARMRVRHSVARLQLRGTIVSDVWPATPAAAAVNARANERTAVGPRGAATWLLPGSSPVARTTVHDVAVLAGTIAANPHIRRRLTLDGAPIADGALIVRATAPLIALARPAAVSTVTSAARMPRASGSQAPPVPALETSAAIALAAHDGFELLAVASGSDAPAEAWRMIDRGFSRFERVQIVHAGQRIGGDVETDDSGTRPVAAITTQGFAVTVRRHGMRSVSAWRQLPAAAREPIEPSQPMGELIFEQNGRIIGAVPLVAPGSAPPHRWLDTARR